MSSLPSPHRRITRWLPWLVAAAALGYVAMRVQTSGVAVRLAKISLPWPAAVALFSGFAPGATEPLRQAAVLAYSVAFQVAGTFATGIIGLLCLRLSTLPLPGAFGAPQSKL